MNSEIENIYKESAHVVSLLNSHGQTSLANFSTDNFRKTLLLASASYFEKCLTDAVLDFSHKVSCGDERLVGLVRNKVVGRTYHQWFSWNELNANSFYSMFGDAFKQKYETKHKLDEKYKSYVLAFLEVGRERNKLVHQNFATFVLQKTLDEIFELHKIADLFVSEMKNELI